MTKDEVQIETMKESVNWIDSGSGRFCRLFVEVLGCDNLPNFDLGGFAGNKTDAFACLVFEDSVVQTDIIDDSLSPRWLPWTKRAFVFHIYHSSSQLFVGVFDYDEGINPADDHNICGRISVDISNFVKDTVYTLKYSLFTSSRVSNREENGTVTLRLRLDIEDERKVILSALEPPPQMYINVKTRKEFRVARSTCIGAKNMEAYDLKILNE